MHIGSGLRDLAAARVAVDWIASFAARARDELGWELHTLDLGGGLGVATSSGEHELSIGEFAGGLLEELERACAQERLSPPELILEPGRSLTARAGVTLYTVGSVKTSADSTAYVAVDGGMSDNPRPALYGARYTALLAERADEPPAREHTIVGKHCESGDLLIDAVPLPVPRRGDILAVPGTGAYTLAMSSTYNAVPRPAAVLVRDGEAIVIRRRETIDDLLGLET
jgi:diaminopimelate decarboxylase